MKRRLLILGVFLLVGAIVNVAVAWSLVWTSSPMFPGDAVSPPADVGVYTVVAQKPGAYSYWRLSRCDRAGATRYMSFWATPESKYALVPGTVPAETLLLPWAAAIAPRKTGARDAVFYRGADARGWPLLSMYSWWDGVVTERWSGNRRRTGVISYSIDEIHSGCRVTNGGRSSSTDIYGVKILPLGVIPTGFVLNTLIYAALIWFSLSAMGHLRRRRRAARGLCPACAYPVGASPVCTECGKPVTPRRAEPVA